MVTWALGYEVKVIRPHIHWTLSWFAGDRKFPPVDPVTSTRSRAYSAGKCSLISDCSFLSFVPRFEVGNCGQIRVESGTTYGVSVSHRYRCFLLFVILPVSYTWVAVSLSSCHQPKYFIKSQNLFVSSITYPATHRLIFYVQNTFSQPQRQEQESPTKPR